MSLVIVGAAESNEVGRLPGISSLGLHLESARNALQDAGLTRDDIDGVATVTEPGPVAIADALGINATWFDSTNVGGTSFLSHVRHAAAAIEAGLCTTVLITHGESGRSRVGEKPWASDPSSLLGQFEMPFGPTGPASLFTLPALRYMKETGTTHEQLAAVPVAQRKWAARNPRAMMRDEITIDDVFASKMIAYPFHVLQCCLVTDGGGALIVTSAERAADLPLRKPLVYVLGSGEGADGPLVSQMKSRTSSRGFRRAGTDAFAQANITHADVDHLMIYDAFAHVPLYGLEDLGFVAPGEAGAFIEEGHTSPGGRLPMNTNGGGLSYTHTGMYGMFAIQESVRQLRGEAAAQLDAPKTSVVLGNGGMFMAASALVLGTESARDRS